MLKGKTKVELFDAETGELIKSVEKHNEITSAYQRLINHLFYVGEILSYTPYVIEAFGGIIMFDSDVPDGAIVQDKTNHCTGMAFYNHSENMVNKVGSYNKTESSIDYDKKIATFVYDFSTSQANGTVKSICLCNGGVLFNNGVNTGSTDPNLTVNYNDYNIVQYGPSNNETIYAYNQVDSYKKHAPLSNAINYYFDEKFDVFFDFDDGIRYVIKFIDSKKFYAIKQTMIQKKWSAFVDHSKRYWQDERNSVEEESIEVDLSSIYGGFETSSGAVRCHITGYKGIMYIMPIISSTQAGGTNLSILKYDFNKFGVEGNEASFFNVLIPTGYDVIANYGAGFYVDSEYVYYVVNKGNGSYIAKSSFTNNADSKILSKINYKPFGQSCCGWLPNTFCCSGSPTYNYSNYLGYYYINLDDGSETSLSNTSYASSYTDKFYFVPDFKTNYIYILRPFSSNVSGKSFYYNYCDYTLKSINNLTDPIVKTNANTMKITYTLTETDS